MSEQPGTAGDPDHTVDVLVIGAGLSGIGAAYRLQTRCPDRSYAVLEARERIGGTWDLFRYPGVRSDSDVFTFSYVFRPWEGDQTLADGESIRRYVETVAAENGIDRRIRFGTRVVHAAWSSEAARWTVTAERTDGTTETWSCAFLYACSGYYDYTGGHTPEFSGREDFRGEVVHPQFWPDDLELAGRRVVVIGSGATAVTLVPALAREGARPVMLQRSPTWIISSRQDDPVTRRIKRRLPPTLAHRALRIRNLAFGQGFYQLTRRRPDLAREYLSKPVVRRMGADFAAEHFSPAYDPWDQRLAVMPDSDLLKAVVRGEAEIVTDTIDRFVPEGVRLASGRVLEADVVVTATGLQMALLSGFTLAVDGVPVRLPERVVYRGLMLDGVPNFALSIGYANASWTLRSDLSSRYVCRFLNHLRRRGRTFGYPVRPAGLEERPVMPLRSGYVQRAMASLPSQGSTGPWRVPQNYVLDLLRMRRARVGEDMRFDVAPEPRVSPHPADRAEQRGRGMSRLAPFHFAGATAVVTGAASGMGEQLAHQLADRGTALVLLDRDADRLDRVAAAVRVAHPGLAVDVHVVDLADTARIGPLVAEVLAVHPRVDLLVNNAGVGLAGRFDQVSLEEFDRVVRVNLTAPVTLTHHLLPTLLANPGSHVVNVSSLYGLIAPIGQSAYSTSKFGLRGFSQVLQAELVGRGVGVTTVHPGGIRTRIAETAHVGQGVDPREAAAGKARMAKLLTYPAERAAADILEAVEHRRVRLLIAPSAKVPDVVARLLPVGHARVLRWLVRRGRRR